MPIAPLRLGLNVDHVATLRNARGGAHPDPVRFAEQALESGADAITAHLREDRRHIGDADMAALAALCRGRGAPLNFELAAAPDVVAIALAVKPQAVCLVPERRAERTTEGGLDLANASPELARAIEALREAGARVSLFLEPDIEAIRRARALGAAAVELHTGRFAEALRAGDQAGASEEFARHRAAAAAAHAAGLEVHAGHGLDFASAEAMAAIPELVEFNIGHFLVGEALFVGLAATLSHMRAAMNRGRAAMVDN